MAKYIDSASNKDGYRVWKINHVFQKHGNGQRANKGKVILAGINDNNKSSLKFTILGYSFNDLSGSNKATSNKNATYSFKIKKDKIYVYHLTPLIEKKVNVRDHTKKIREIISSFIEAPKSINPKMKADRQTAQSRVAQVFNHWLKLNKFPRRFVFRKKTPLADQITNFIFPTLKNFEVTNPNSTVNLPFMKDGKGVKAVIKKCFGSAGNKTVKLILKVCKERNDLSVLKFGQLLKNIVTIDVIQCALEDFKGSSVSGLNIGFPGPRGEYTPKYFKDFFKAQPETARNALIKDLSNSQAYIIKDTVSQYNTQRANLPNIPLNINSSWDLFHDWLSEQRTARYKKAEEVKLDFSYTEEELKLDNLKAGDLELILPKDNYELSAWGKELHHCVGGYSRSVESKYCLILGVKKENKIKYCIELRQNKIQQFRGTCNCDPDADDKKVVLDNLKEFKIEPGTYV